MGNRYIERFQLPRRQYFPGSPVVLAAGALLKDTKIPRMVAQLKFNDISAKPIAALTVKVRCLREGADTGEVEFCYDNLTVKRGQSFGQYTAIVLPVNNVDSFTAIVSKAIFADGSVWEAPKTAEWKALPVFEQLKNILPPELLALCHEAMPQAKFSYSSPDDLWYCTCGGVNHRDEFICHRCGKKHNLVSKYANIEELTALYEARQKEDLQQAEEQEAQEERQLSDAARETGELQKEHSKTKRTGRKKLLLACCICVAIAVAIIPWAKSMLGDNADINADAPILSDNLPDSKGPITDAKVSDDTEPAPDASVPDSAEPATNTDASDSAESNKKDHPIKVTTVSDIETVSLNMHEDDDGRCSMTIEMVQERFPQVEYIEFNGVPNMENNIDNYLINSYQMAVLVSTSGEKGGDDRTIAFSPKDDPDSPRCLLLFDSKTNLMGHAVGVPEKISDKVWRLNLTLCDYDFTDLYKQQSEAYYASGEMPYIAPEDVKSSGAEWFLNAYNMRSDNEELRNCQMYHLWSQTESPYLYRHCRSMDEYERRGPRGDANSPRWTYYLLLDKNREVIGYTVRTTAKQ